MKPSRNALYLTLVVATVSLAAVAVGWLIVAPWRLARITAEIQSGTVEPVTAVLYLGPVVLGVLAGLVRPRNRPAPLISDNAA